MVQKSKKPPVAEDRRPRAAQAPRPAARLSAGRRARQGARSVSQGWLRRDLARRSLCRHRHEPAEPLRRVRRQARAVHQELPPLSRRRARGDGRHLPRRTADPPAAGADLCGGARHLSVRRIRSARLLHGDDGGLRGGARSRYPRHGAGRLCRTRQGFCGLFPAAPGRRANCPKAPIRSCWPNSPPPPSTPSRSAPAPGRRARNWRRSSRARSM